MALSSKKGFTLLEMMVTIIVISVAFIAVLQLVSSGTRYAAKTQQQITAAQLAQEGLEAVYQIRNTNRLRRAGFTDSCRLKTDPLVDVSNDGCMHDPRIQSGYYALQQAHSGGNRYWLVSGYTSDDITGGNLQAATGYALCYNNNMLVNCPSDRTGTIAYYRIIQSKGLFRKDVSETGGRYIACSDGEDIQDSITCGEDNAKELRFCSTVRYRDGLWQSLTLCSMLTNFR